jgi:hypothetical protein
MGFAPTTRLARPATRDRGRSVTNNTTPAGMPEWFGTWFAAKFNLPVPEALAEYLANHANGMWSQAGSLWKAEAIIDATEERDLQQKGVCMIGETAFEAILLLRARDGRFRGR